LPKSCSGSSSRLSLCLQPPSGSIETARFEIGSSTTGIVEVTGRSSELPCCLAWLQWLAGLSSRAFCTLREAFSSNHRIAIAAIQDRADQLSCESMSRL